MKNKSEGTTPPQESITFDAIEWPEERPLRDEKLWEENRNVIKMLLSIGESTSLLKGVKGRDTYMKMPQNYNVDGVEIRFLPHWGFYEVGGMVINTPKSEEDIRRDVEAAKYLSSRGFKPKK